MFGPSTFLGLAHDYKNLSDWIDSNLIPETAHIFRIPESACFASFYGFDSQDTGKYFKGGFPSIHQPIPDSVVKTAGTLSMPSLWVLCH
jgi:hypothetical protein